MGTKLDATVVTTIKHYILGEKVPVPEHVLAYILVNTEDEAHYICSILNSSFTNLILQSIAKGGKNFATPEFINMINIKRYDPSNALHRKLTELSKKAHLLAQQNNESELKRVEEEIDKIVAQLYDLTDEEHKEIKKCLAILEGEDVEEEEIEELPTLNPDITLRNNVVEENHPFTLEVVVQNPLDEAICDVKVKVELLGRTVERMFRSLEGEEAIPIRLDGLREGRYDVKLTMDYNLEGSNKRLEKTLSLFVKGWGRKEDVDRGKAEEIFGGVMHE
jgi:hypothetical protein